MVKLPPENTCAWCGEFVDEDVEIHAIGAKFPDGVDMKENEGNIIFFRKSPTYSPNKHTIRIYKDI